MTTAISSGSQSGSPSASLASIRNALRGIRTAAAAAALALAAIVPGSAVHAQETYVFSGFTAVNQHLAKISGIWKDAPYKAEFVQTTFPESVAGLNAGTLLLGFYGITTALRQQAESTPQWTVQTAPIKLVYGYRSASESLPVYPYAAILVRNDAKITTEADLRGKTWASQVGGDIPTVYYAGLQKAGLTVKDIKEITADSYGPLVAAFRAGEAQVLAASPALVIDLIESGQARVFYTADELRIAVFPGFAALAKSLDDPKLEGVIRDFLVRFNRFNAWKEANPDEHRKALIRIGQFRERLADFEVAQFRGIASIRIDDLLVSSAQRSVDLLHWAGQVPRRVEPANIWATYDARFNAATDAVPYLFRNYEKTLLTELLQKQKQTAPK